jgi:hypothetical protein
VNQDHDHIQHPRLGQVPTNGNRFTAIMEAAAKLHTQQLTTRIGQALESRLNTRMALRSVPSNQWLLVGEEVQEA